MSTPPLPPLDPVAIRTALDGIPGLTEARIVDDREVYVLLEGHDMDRDDRVVKALLDLDPEPADFFLVPASMAGTVPEGVTASRR